MICTNIINLSPIQIDSFARWLEKEADAIQAIVNEEKKIVGQHPLISHFEDKIFAYTLVAKELRGGLTIES